MRRIDELYLAYPFYGSRQMVRHLQREGTSAGAPSSPAVDAIDGPGDDLLQAAHQRRAPGPPNLSYLLQGLRIDRPGSGLVRRHHLYPCLHWLSVPGGGDGLGQPSGVVLAALEHNGQPFLHRCT